MKKTIEYQKTIDVESTIELASFEEDVYTFSIERIFADGLFDKEVEEVQAIFDLDGEVLIEPYHSCSEEEENTIKQILLEIREKGNL